MKILIHVGLHRAASTSFQNWLVARREAWADARVFVHDRMSSARSASPFALLAGNQSAAMDTGAMADFLLAALQELGGHYTRGIVSDENLAGPMAGPGQPPFRRFEYLCAVLDRLGEHHDIVPVMVLRGHASWLVSLFKTYQARGGTKNFRQFALAAEAPRLRFAPLLQRLAQGRRMIVDSVEQIAADSGARLLRRVTSELDLPSQDLCLPRDNAAFGGLRLRVAAGLGAHHAMLAGHGGPAMAEAAAMDAEALARLVHERAVKVNWAAPAGRRMNRATAIYRKGTPPGSRVSLDICRDIVARALAAGPEAPDLSDLPLDAFAADRQDVAQTYLPEWRATAT